MSDLPEILDLVWQRLGRGVADRRAPARHPVLATVSPEGWPEARTVVLRRADRAAGLLEVHTDSRSGKAAALALRPRAELVVWDPVPRLQIRARCEAGLLAGPEAAARWSRVPSASREGYGRRPPPGSVIAAPGAYDSPADPAAFLVLLLRVAAIDALLLGEPQRRARFVRDGGWAGEWLVP